MNHHDPFRAQRPAGGDKPAASSGTGGEAEQHDHLNSMRLPDLRALAESLGIDSTGKRGELIGRIRAHQTGASSST